MKRFRFAVLGTGFWSRYQIPAWLETGKVQLVALYNRTRRRAEEVGATFGVERIYDDPEELFRNEKLDFVDIITEVPAHAPLVLMAARHRVPVICQKPMAGDYATAVTMVETCEAVGVPFFVHENYRWQHPIRAIKQAIEEGQIGSLFRLRLEFVHALTDAAWQNQPLLKGLEHLILADQGSHQLDLARFLYGEPTSLYCSSLRVRDDIAGEDVASIQLRRPDALCEVALSFVSNNKRDHFPEVIIRAEGTRGTIELEEDFWMRTTTPEGTWSRRVGPPRYPWAHPDYAVNHASMVPIHEDFLRYFESGSLPETTGRDNLKTMRLVFAAYESAAANKVIDLETAPEGARRP